MKTVIVIQVDHDKQIPGLANMVAGRAWSIGGVTKAEVMKLAPMTHDDLERAGFSESEITLGSQEVHR